MKTIEKADEKRLIGAIERAISLTNKGMGPTDAITKIAREERFKAPFIHRMVESFNKSLSVHRLKEAAEDERHKTFDLADSDTVISNVFTDIRPMDKSAAAEDQFSPAFKFDVKDMFNRRMDKTAAPVEKEMTITEKIEDARQRASRLYKQAHVVTAVRQKLHTQVLIEKRAFDKSIERACELLLPMSDKALKKVAQALVNGYSGTGDKLVKVFAHKTRRPIPTGLSKTANAVVFPAAEPYLTVAKVYENAEKLAAAESELRQFDKHALDFGSSFAANALANLTAPGEERLGESLQGVEKSKTVDPDELLDPVFYNRLRELDAKRALMSLVLHDPDLKDYKYSDIVKAYNTSVSSVPQAQGNPVVLKTLLMKNLESSGIKDVFELSQEQSLAKGMSEADLANEKVRVSRAPEKEESPTKRTAITSATAPSLGSKDLAARARATADKAFKAGPAGKEEETDDMKEWREKAILEVLKGGNKKAQMNTNILGRFPASAGAQRAKPAQSIDDIANDLRTIYTKPQSEWGDARFRARHQYGITP